MPARRAMASKDVAGCRESGFDAGVLRMHAARHHAADAGHQLGVLGHGDDAGGGADDVDHIAFAAARAQSRPSAHRMRRREWECRRAVPVPRPMRRKVSGEVIGGEIVAGELFANAVKQRVDLGKKRLRRQAVPLGIPHPLVAHGADAALGQFGIGDAAERGRHHVAVLEGGGELRALVRDCGAASAAAWQSPTRASRRRRTTRSLPDLPRGPAR